MIHRLKSLRHLPLPIFLLCGGVLLAVAVSAIISQRLMIHKLETTSNQYGSSLANIAARQAIDAILDHDLISLQVILGDIAENPDVLVTTIHDVENQLLAQAGELNKTSSPPSYHRHFTKTITLHDSVAGYVTVTIDQQSTEVVKQQLYWMFSLSGVLLLALTITAYFFGRSRSDVEDKLARTESIDIDEQTYDDADTAKKPSLALKDFQFKTETRKNLPEDAAVNVDAALPATAETETEPQQAPGNHPGYQAVLYIAIHNLELLRQQLSQSRFRALQFNFQHILKEALPLYNADMQSLDDRNVVVIFDSVESLQESVFHACCYAKLVAALNSDNQSIPVEFSSFIVAGDDCQNVQSLGLDLITAADADIDNLFLLQEMAFDPTLAGKLVADSVAREFAQQQFVQVTSVREPYAQLLEKQRQKLRKSRAGGLPIYSAT